MPSQGGFIAGYNGQTAVDAAHQIIVAHCLATNPADFAALVPLVDQARANLGRTLREVSGDTGFATEANLEAMAARRVAAYLSPGRIRHGATDPTVGRVLKRKPRMPDPYTPLMAVLQYAFNMHMIPVMPILDRPADSDRRSGFLEAV